ncbi:MAG TPA: ribosomal protein S18-alanine N-acetyltransferase [Bryobacteraceae bacterium]|nr:ribosomal protein S18-alanine N-acetyltransferase [Bryobacteraceae bacterium]
MTPIVRKITPDDLREVLEIEREAFRDRPWAAEDFRIDDCLVAEIDGRIVGFLVSRQTFPAAAGERAEREILNVATRREYQRKGIATALLHRELSKRAIYFLEVRESNLAARDLYRKLGFVEVARRPEYYEFPVETAIVMQMK